MSLCTSWCEREYHTRRLAGRGVFELLKTWLHSRSTVSILSSASQPNGSGQAPATAASATATIKSTTDHSTATATATACGDDDCEPEFGMCAFYLNVVLDSRTTF